MLVGPIAATDGERSAPNMTMQGCQEITDSVVTDQAEGTDAEYAQVEPDLGGTSHRNLLDAGQNQEEYHGHTPTEWAKRTILVLPTPAGCTATAHGTGTQSGEASGRLEPLGIIISTLIEHPRTDLPCRS